ncbi:hypothetical protein PPERSA_10014 [Pseudocohnilembus persalinus]|uniref:Uncharacterized protein n=1 Tax=Pseudocohnilembus persalinus TaxID=266149 RepID=A0A0V0QJE9_PSEPJ|nr:hypothetical protein PPERSA_10014 [Pseudocohnilembus persalinus]|eukprot:KRX02397.1 hypothetical protein PPERSA_10014 [Pseudocohnilembus persalinus]
MNKKLTLGFFRQYKNLQSNIQQQQSYNFLSISEVKKNPEKFEYKYSFFTNRIQQSQNFQVSFFKKPINFQKNSKAVYEQKLLYSLNNYFTDRKAAVTLKSITYLSKSDDEQIRIQNMQKYEKIIIENIDKIRQLHTVCNILRFYALSKLLNKQFLEKIYIRFFQLYEKQYSQYADDGNLLQTTAVQTLTLLNQIQQKLQTCQSQQCEQEQEKQKELLETKKLLIGILDKQAINVIQMKHKLSSSVSFILFQNSIQQITKNQYMNIDLNQQFNDVLIKNLNDFKYFYNIEQIFFLANLLEKTVDGCFINQNQQISYFKNNNKQTCKKLLIDLLECYKQKQNKNQLDQQDILVYKYVFQTFDIDLQQYIQ